MAKLKILLIVVPATIFLGLCYVNFFVEHITPFSSKAAASAMLTEISKSKGEIEALIIDNGLGAESMKLIKIPVATNIEYGIDEVFIGRYGTIVAHNKKFDVTVITEPKIIGQKIVWSCTGFPTKALPKQCLKS